MTAVVTAPRAARHRPAVVEMVLEHARLWALFLVVVVWVAIWAVTQGQRFGPPLFFVPLPTSVKAYAYRELAKVKVAA